MKLEPRGLGRVWGWPLECVTCTLLCKDLGFQIPKNGIVNTGTAQPLPLQLSIRNLFPAALVGHRKFSPRKMLKQRFRWELWGFEEKNLTAKMQCPNITSFL